MAKKRKIKRRSECPLNASVEMLGDRWSLLIIRDMMLRGFRSYSQFLECYEGIATNILADRLRKLVASGIITTQPDPSDGRKSIYLLTAKGIDLAPVLTEMVLWAAAHEKTGNQGLVQQMRADKEKVIRRCAKTLGRPAFSPTLTSRLFGQASFFRPTTSIRTSHYTLSGEILSSRSTTFGKLRLVFVAWPFALVSLNCIPKA